MQRTSFVMATDRGGHLYNALKLIEQLQKNPDAFVTTHGPDIDSLKQEGNEIYEVPYLFSWSGKTRWFNPWSAIRHLWISFSLARKLRAKTVISLGASNVVCFCYFARFFGAEILHVECMNQVRTRSITGKLLYPIAKNVLVQWPELLSEYGPKARYEGWVL